MNELQRQVLQHRQVRIEMRAVFPAAGMDNKYKVLVNLQRSDRPRVWSFQCMNCGSKIAELMNQEVYGINDFFDPQNPNNHGIGRQCKGTAPNGRACPYMYFFQLQ